jgi:transposase
MRNPTAQTVYVLQGCGGKATIMLGIDVSKATLSCALRDPTTRALRWEITVPNTAPGVDTLLEKTPPHTDWVLEPTGRYSTRVVQQARQAGQNVLLAPPRKAKAFLQSVQSRAKTDRFDSRGLALFALSQPLAPYPLKEAALDAIDQLLSARKGLAGSIMKLQLQQQELPQAAPFLAEAIADLKQRLRALDHEIARQSGQVPGLQAAQELVKVPGIGPVTAVAVTVRLAAKQFSHPDQFVAYLGLDVGIAESGKHKGQRGLTHQGDAELRRLLYVCAQANLRCKSSPFQDQYERERAKGLSSTAALCAVGRKLARLCWSLHKHGTVYEAARVGQPLKRAPRPPEVSETEKS